MESSSPGDSRIASPGAVATVGALNFATVAVYADLYITQPILPLLSKEYHVAPATAGLTISVVVLMIAVVSSAYGSLSDAVGRKAVMVASCFLLAIPTLLCALASSFRMLLVFRALQGFLMPGVTAVAVAYIGDSFSEADLGPRVGGWIAASVAGGLTGRVLSGLLAAGTNWRAPFLFFGLVTLVGAAAIARGLPAGQGLPGLRLGSAYRGMFVHFRNRRLIGAFVIGGGVFFAFIGVFTYLPYYLTGPPFRLSTALVSSVYLVYIAGVFTSVVSGKLSGRVGRRGLMAAGLAIAGVGILGTLVHSLPAIVVSLVVLCVGMFAVQSTAPAFVNANAAGAKGAAGALYVTFYYLGASVGSFLPGYAWQAWGWPGVAGSCLAALAVGLAADWLLCARTP
ncbi:MAG TPA: MFS transporter [Thermoanaerobaculia bacterium]|nr:MFS transporter [Thermoanaerobaculia bacterium]